MQGKGKVKHNLNRNYNLMGFDTIEINLVWLQLTTTCQWAQVAKIIKQYPLSNIRNESPLHHRFNHPLPPQPDISHPKTFPAPIYYPKLIYESPLS